MRIHKYRVWDKERKRFITDVEWGKLRKKGWYFDIFNGDMRQVISREPNYEERIVDTVGLMKYTGLKDKNGKEAYEGDIYHCGYKYEDGTHKYGDKNIIKDIRDFEPEDNFTIIGNIYENKELIES